MNISFPSATAFSHRAWADNGGAPAFPRPTRHRQGGMAVIVMLALLAIILLYIAANIHSLYSLQRELKLTEQRQERRLAALSAANAAGAIHAALTNAPPAAAMVQRSAVRD